MFSMTDMPSSASTLFTAYASFAASMMLVRSMANELIPSPIRSYIESGLRYLFTPISNQLTIVVDEQFGIGRNEIYDAAEIYLRTKISPSTARFKVGKSPRRKTLIISMEKGDEITDTYQNFDLKWKFFSIEPPKDRFNAGEKRFFELCFDKKFKDRVLNEYLPFVLARSVEIKEGDKVVKLYTRDCGSYNNDDERCGGGGGWGSINLEHPSTFETLAMDSKTKKMIIEDLERFLRRREFYKKVGKAWKRGYLLYGPPGTGKSSLIAAMANYLKFDVYDLELTSLYSNSDLRRILVSTTNRSIVVIEDIDCNVEMKDRQLAGNAATLPFNLSLVPSGGSDSKLTLSGLLNFIDGLWSSVGDERIIVFTTNHKDRLDPALLRPGRMDVHIHMSYCTTEGFKVLARNYLGIQNNDLYHRRLFGDIESLIQNVEVTPAEVAEELMKSEDADVALGEVVNFLKRKQSEANETKEEKSDDGNEVQEAKRVKTSNNIMENVVRKCTRKRRE